MKKNLFVSGLNPQTTNQQLKTHFLQAGTVVSVRIITDRSTSLSRGFGFVEMSTEKEAENAIALLHKSTLADKSISVREERSQKTNRTTNTVNGQSSHRRKWGLVI